MLLLKPSRRASGRPAESYDMAPFEVPARPSRPPMPQRPQGGSSAGRSGKPVFLLALTVGLCGGIFYFSSREDYLLGQIAAALIALLGLYGLWRGGFRKGMMLAVLMALFAYHDQLHKAVVTGLAAIDISSESAAKIATLLASFFAWLATFFLTRTIRRRFIEKRRAMLAFDRVSGLTLGLAEGAVVLLCLCWMATSLVPYGRTVASARGEEASVARTIGETILRLDEESRARFLGDFVTRTNPIERIPALQKMLHDLNTIGRVSSDQLDSATLEQLRRMLEQLPGGVSGDLGNALESVRKGGVRGSNARKSTGQSGSR